MAIKLDQLVFSTLFAYLKNAKDKKKKRFIISMFVILYNYC